MAKTWIPKIDGKKVLDGVPSLSLHHIFPKQIKQYTLDPVEPQHMSFIWKEHSDEFYPKFSHEIHFTLISHEKCFPHKFHLKILFS